MMPTYQVVIVKREFLMTSDDYHATVTRLADDVELIWIAPWKWYLKWQLRPRAIHRAFKRYDTDKAHMEEAKEEYVV